MSKAESFIKQFVAFVKGDDAEVLAQKALRSADSALTSHIAIAKGDLVSKEDAVESAQEALASARVNGGAPIVDRDQYVRNLINAKNALIDAEEALEAHQEMIEFLEENLASLK